MLEDCSSQVIGVTWIVRCSNQWADVEAVHWSLDLCNSSSIAEQRADVEKSVGNHYKGLLGVRMP